MVSGLKKEETIVNHCVYNLFMDQSGGWTLVLYIYISKKIHWVLSEDGTNREKRKRLTA